MILALVFGVCVSSLTAQTRRTKPKPLATPRVMTGAEIISQSGNEAEPVSTNEEEPVKPATTSSERRKQSNDRVKKPSYEDRQKRMLMNLDILKRSEERADSLRDQFFKMIEKENSITARVEQIDFDSRPEIIERTLQLAGSMRPEEIRENRRKSLAAEKANLQVLLTQVQATRSGLDASLRRADQMVERLRAQVEKDIENSLDETNENAEK
jgi:hypothetical protein